MNAREKEQGGTGCSAANDADVSFRSPKATPDSLQHSIPQIGVDGTR